jgi:hypothetical protein
MVECSPGSACRLDLDSKMLKLKLVQLVLKTPLQLVRHESFSEFRAFAGNRLRGSIIDALSVRCETFLALDLTLNSLLVLTE